MAEGCFLSTHFQVKDLLEKGATPNTQDNARWTPLHEVAQKGFTEIARLLLENGANPNVPGMVDGVRSLMSLIAMIIQCVQKFLKFSRYPFSQLYVDESQNPLAS